MTTQHTPGPWSTGHNVYGHSRLAVLNTRSVIIAEVTDWPDEDMTEANARLIAAAPDLLAELELVVAGWEEIERGEVRGRRLTAWEEERLSFARSAILQTRGPVIQNRKS